MRRSLAVLSYCLLLASCDEKDKGPDYQDFLNTVNSLAPTLETKSCGDYRLDSDLREFNCCIAGEVAQGLPVTGTLRNQERTLGQGYILNADRSGKAIVYFRFVGDFTQYDAFGNPRTEHFDSRDIDQATCPQWSLDEDACNLSSRVALSCPDLSEFN